jgi:uncharacterized protein YggE
MRNLAMPRPARRFAQLLAPLLVGVAGAMVLPAAAMAAPGEIPLHITARGVVPPDVLTMPLPLNGSGATREAAEASLKLQQEQTLKELGKAGIDVGKAELSPIETAQLAAECFDSESCGAAAAAAMVDAAAADDDAEPGKKPSRKERKKREKEAAAAMAAMQWTASATLTVEMDPAKFFELRSKSELTAISGNPFLYGTGMSSLFGFRDRAAAKASALDKAMANARTEADAYAAALGYKVVRIAGASNAPAPFAATDLVSVFSKMDGMLRDPAFMTSEVANVTIDFVIAPK